MQFESFQALYLVLAAVNLAVSMAAGALAWNARRAVTSANIAAAAAQVAPLLQRVVNLEKEAELTRSRLREAEQKIAAAPGEKAISEIKIDIAKIAGDINTVRAKVEGLDNLVERVEAAVSMHQEHLLKTRTRPAE